MAVLKSTAETDSIELPEDEHAQSDDGTTEVFLEDDVDDDDGSAAASQGEEPKQTRRDRRRERGELRETAERFRRENDELRERLSRIEESHAHSQNEQQLRPQWSPADVDAEYERRMTAEVYEPLRSLQARRNSEAQANNGNLPQDRQLFYEREASRLNLRQTELAQQAIQAKSYDPQRAAMAQLQSQLQMRIPDIVSDQRRWRLANAEFETLKALRGTNPPQGSQQYWDLVDEAADNTRRRFKIGPYAGNTEPDQADRHLREHHIGVRRGAVGDSGSGRPTTFKLSREQQRMAEAMYEDEGLSRQDAWKRWAREVGTKLSR
jgi:hypothetical protein